METPPDSFDSSWKSFSSDKMLSSSALEDAVNILPYGNTRFVKKLFVYPVDTQQMFLQFTLEMQALQEEQKLDEIGMEDKMKAARAKLRACYASYDISKTRRLCFIINQDKHWFLAMVQGPESISSRVRRLLIFDSIRRPKSYHRKHTKWIGNFLYENRHEADWPGDKLEMHICTNIPMQTDEINCGRYVANIVRLLKKYGTSFIEASQKEYNPDLWAHTSISFVRDIFDKMFTLKSQTFKGIDELYSSSEMKMEAEAFAGRAGSPPLMLQSDAEAVPSRQPLHEAGLKDTVGPIKPSSSIVRSPESGAPPVAGRKRPTAPRLRSPSKRIRARKLETATSEAGSGTLSSSSSSEEGRAPSPDQPAIKLFLRRSKAGKTIANTLGGRKLSVESDLLLKFQERACHQINFIESLPSDLNASSSLSLKQPGSCHDAMIYLLSKCLDHDRKRKKHSTFNACGRAMVWQLFKARKSDAEFLPLGRGVSTVTVALDEIYSKLKDPSLSRPSFAKYIRRCQGFNEIFEVNPGLLLGWKGVKTQISEYNNFLRTQQPRVYERLQETIPYMIQQMFLHIRESGFKGDIKALSVWKAYLNLEPSCQKIVNEHPQLDWIAIGQQKHEEFGPLSKYSRENPPSETGISSGRSITESPVSEELTKSTLQYESPSNFDREMQAISHAA